MEINDHLFFKLKKPYYLVTFGPFPQFWGQKKYFPESCFA